LDLARLYDATPIPLMAHVMRGKQDGPVSVISAGIHGDEINGVEIARQLLFFLKPALIRGTVVVIPVINIYGFFEKSRYLPDRRDLNRSFPGNPEGSLAAQIAHCFLEKVGRLCDYSIDLHSGASFRKNWPQLRGDMKDPTTLALAKKFGAPALLHAPLVKGSLREALVSLGKKALLYESGEALQVDPFAVKIGVQGVLKVLKETNGYKGAIPKSPLPSALKSCIYHRSRWLRAPESGMFYAFVDCGDPVKKGKSVGEVCFPHSQRTLPITAPFSGRVIGTVTSPLALKGEALLHIADEKRPHYETFSRKMRPRPEGSKPKR